MSLKKFEQPQVARQWLTSSTAKLAYTYIPADSPLPGIGATEVDAAGDADPIAYIKLFDPMGSWTWYLLEADRESGEAYGLVDGFELELGYIDLNELAQCRRLPIERDIHFKPMKLSEVYKAKEEGRHV